MASRRWFDFSELDVTGVDPIAPVASISQITPLQLPPPAVLASSGWVERQTGDFCGCCGNCGDCGNCGNCCGLGKLCCRPAVEIDEFGRLVTRPRCCGLKTSNLVGLVLYALVLACAVLLFYALSLILSQIADEGSGGSGSVNGTLGLVEAVLAGPNNDKMDIGSGIETGIETGVGSGLLSS